jgi:hypothetical protein
MEKAFGLHASENMEHHLRMAQQLFFCENKLQLPSCQPENFFSIAYLRG